MSLSPQALGPRAPFRRIPRRRFGAADLPLAMAYVYVAVIAVAVLVLEPALLDGSGAMGANFSLVVPLALVAFGQTLAMLTRGIDLSVGGVISLSSALLATHLNARG